MNSAQFENVIPGPCCSLIRIGLVLREWFHPEEIGTPEWDDYFCNISDLPPLYQGNPGEESLSVVTNSSLLPEVNSNEMPFFVGFGMILKGCAFMAHCTVVEKLDLSPLQIEFVMHVWLYY